MGVTPKARATAACDSPRANRCAARNRRASSAAKSRRAPRRVGILQHHIVALESHNFISRDSLGPAFRAELSALKRLCYAGLDSETLRRRVADRLTWALDLDAFCFPAADPATALPVHVLHEGRPPAAFEEFLHRVYLHSMISDIGRCAALPRRVWLVEEMLPASRADRDPYVDVMLRPYGLRHEVHLSLAIRGTPWGHLCLSRRARDYGREELALLECLVPHLRAGLRAAWLRTALKARPGTGIGVVLLDGEDRIQLANGVAERFLACSGPRSRAAPLAGLRWLARLLGRTLDGDDDAVLTVPFVVLAYDGGAGAWRLSAERVPGDDGAPRTLILLEPARPTETPGALRALGLTAREAEVARAVIRGTTASDTAAQLGISPHTVLHHLRRVYEKLGVSSRAELALRLAGAETGDGGAGTASGRRSSTRSPATSLP
jgi:DNA-binding CsgD family transcriptional regulator